MHWSRRVALTLLVMVAAVGVVVAVGAAALGAADAAPRFPHIAPARVPRPAGAKQVVQRGYVVTLTVRPNVSTVLNTISVRLTRNGRPVSAARVTATVRMLEMTMPARREALRATGAGRYVSRATVLGMVGRWGLHVTVVPRGGAPFSTQLAD